MKITKLELKNMIREVLREELESLKESADKEYYVELSAHDAHFNEYTDNDNEGKRNYCFWGTKNTIVNKLNQISKTYDFSFIMIYDGPRSNSNCIFNANEENISTGEHFDAPVIWYNTLIDTKELFMKKFIQK